MLTEIDISELKIGYATIAVNEVAAIEKDYDYGEFDSTKKTITINKELNQTDKINTLIHEIFHAILWERGVADSGGILDQKEKEEENIVNCLGNGFVQLIQDNPQIISVLNLLHKQRK